MNVWMKENEPLMREIGQPSEEKLIAIQFSSRLHAGLVRKDIDAESDERSTG